MKTKELKGKALDWVIARCEGVELIPCTKYGLKTLVRREGCGYNRDYEEYVDWSPTTKWNQGGPIYEREISNSEKRDGYFYAHRWMKPRHRAVTSLGDGNFIIHQDEPERWAYGETLLIAAMRCYAAAKLGDEIDVPVEMLG